MDKYVIEVLDNRLQEEKWKKKWFHLFIYRFICYAAWHAGSQFPDWEWNPHLLCWKCGVITTRVLGKQSLQRFL